jgi:hypothetical protein
MSAIPTFSEIRWKARREKATIEAVVMLASDALALVRFGPRGGFKILGKA